MRVSNTAASPRSSACTAVSAANAARFGEVATSTVWPGCAEQPISKFGLLRGIEQVRSRFQRRAPWIAGPREGGVGTTGQAYGAGGHVRAPRPLQRANDLPAFVAGGVGQLPRCQAKTGAGPSQRCWCHVHALLAGLPVPEPVGCRWRIHPTRHDAQWKAEETRSQRRQSGLHRASGAVNGWATLNSPTVFSRLVHTLGSPVNGPEMLDVARPE